MSTNLEKISAPWQPPVILQTVIALGARGEIYELPPDVAERFKVGAARLQEIGHPPLLVRAAQEAESEVQGHHKVPGASGAAGTDWGYHTTWEYGCYQDQASGQFAVGFHRHPFSDERAVGAEPQDFA